MTPTARIRPGVPADVDAVARLSHALWPEGSVEEHATEIAAILAGRPLSTMPLVIFVAEIDGATVGFIEVGLRSHADGCDAAHPVGFIEGWCVDAAHRGQAVGRALMAAAEEWAIGQGCHELASDTWLDNEPSQRAHEALGFEVVDRCVNYKKPLR
jgi:aminoglycoside 6'-N-acetyltransferase I